MVRGGKVRSRSQIEPNLSISDQRASTTSFVRHALRMRNRNMAAALNLHKGGHELGNIGVI
jgi:hypothetical protein